MRSELFPHIFDNYLSMCYFNAIIKIVSVVILSINKLVSKAGSKQMKTDMVPQETIDSMIYTIRGHKIMLSADLAELYDVEPKALMQAVKRNVERFPPYFIFQLTYQ
jgi:hypothetical protein